MVTIDPSGMVPGPEPSPSHRRYFEPKHLVLPSVGRDSAVISDAAQAAAEAVLEAGNRETFEPNPLVLPSVQPRQPGTTDVAEAAARAVLKAALDKISRQV